MYGQGPQRMPRDGTERLLQRIKELEMRLAGVERRGSSATYAGAGVTNHALRHATGGGDDLDPADIGAATQTDMTAAEGDISDLQGDVAALPTTYTEDINGDGTTTDFTITHNGGTRNCIVALRSTASPYASVPSADYSLEYTDNNNIELIWGTAPANGDGFKVLVLIF